MSNQQIVQKNDIRSLMQSDNVRQQISLALPKFLTPERMLRVCLTSVNRNPKLLECSPQSLLSSVMQAAQMGIEPDGRNGHLIPRYNSKAGCMEATFMPDYKGLVALVRRNDNVADIYAEPVYDGDEFKITKGLHRDLVHNIDIRADRGEFLGAYAVIAYRDGTHSFEFMTKREIDGIKNRSQSGNSGPWVTDYTEMAKKTVIKRLLKLADLSPEIAERVAVAIENDDSGPQTTRQEVRIEPAQVQTAPVPQLEAPEVQDEQPANVTPIDEADDIPMKASPAPETKAPDKKSKLPRKKEPEPKAYLEPEKPAAPTQEAPTIDVQTEEVQQVDLTPNQKAVLAKLDEAGFDVADLLKVALANEWCPPCDPITTGINHVEDHVLAVFLEEWTELVEEIQKGKDS